MNKSEEIKTVAISLSSELLRHARDLRKNLTDAEKLLWQIVRNLKLNNWKSGGNILCLKE
ncbi:MAG: DUF559 domain-containing protein [Bacteroidales bacterium]|nr:DUF559 domain-containing protein [Bacteroidales bacterium]